MAGKEFEKGSILSENLIDKEIEKNYLIYNELLEKSERYIRQGKYIEACLNCQLAAHFLWYNHAGIFVSNRLERILIDIGSKIQGEDSVSDESGVSEGESHVCHVITQANSIGGHTRLLCNWIEFDNTRKHSVIITRQGVKPIPEILVDSVKNAGGGLIDLSGLYPDIMGAAQRLRELGARANYIVLHIHPDDILPILAFAKEKHLPPVIFMNHADHVFWIGSSVSSLILNIRETGKDLAIHRRGIPAEKCEILPIPVVPERREFTIDEAKEKLGISPDCLLLLSIGSEYKYAETSGISFIDTHLPIVERATNSVFIVIGPSPESEKWRQASESTNGRFYALGKCEDLSLYYQAADIFVESFPCGSLTAMLEAISYEVPVISYDPFSGAAALLQCDDPGILHEMHRYDVREEYVMRLNHLVDNAKERKEMGGKMHKYFIAFHSPEPWVRSVDEVYNLAHLQSKTYGSGRIGGGEDAFSSLEMWDRLIFRLHAGAGLSGDVRGIYKRLLPLYPLSIRIACYMQSLLKGNLISPESLLSERFRNKIGGFLAKNHFLYSFVKRITQ